MSSKTLEINLLGKAFAVACPPGQEEQLRRVADRLQERLEQLRQRTGSGNLEQLAVMAALNLSHELMVSEQQQAVTERQMATRIQVLQDAIEQALSERLQNRPKRVEADSPSPYTGEDG
ncbi:cell division protein ZapA [Ferrimonas balearica]|uniref:cell division protein ZapA n=1 Tax=Ferrimonas balearica TaxID=44012 RepID=UPI001C9A1486|nr:cell division protein ZapA [Ferrimonas balearica]MBY5993595.1 cell division protein ZapA [Ferrimonas balearica]